MGAILDELVDLEHRGWQSLCDGSGADFYGSLMTDDGLMLLAHGQALDRHQVVESLGSAPTWDSFEMTDERLVELSDGAAALTYTGRAERDGQPPFVGLMASVYTRRDGRWRLALYQQTPVPAQA